MDLDLPADAFWAAVALLALSSLGLFAATLVFGPRAGAWNQPAARLRPTGRRVRLALYIFGALHVVLALVAAIAMDGANLLLVAIGVFTGAFYVACAWSWTIAVRLAARVRSWRGEAEPPPEDRGIVDVGGPTS